MRQREFILGADRRRRSTLRGGAARSRRPAPRDGLRRAHAHAARAADDGRALPAGGHRAARARRRAAAGAPTIARTGIRSAPARSPAPGFPIDRELTARAARLRRPDRQHLRQHRHRRLPARERVGGAGAARRPRPRSSRTCCSGARAEFGYLRLGDGFVQCEQHHAAEAQPGRARARARDRQQGARPGAGDRHAPSTTRPFGDIVDTEDDLQPLVSSMFRDATRAVRLVAAAMRRRSSTRRGSRRAPARAGRR